MHAPTALHRIACAGNLIKANKFQLIIQLNLEGWVEGHPCEVLHHDGQHIYKAGKSTSYYACLLQRDNIFKKGLTGILHSRTDNYYKCLLLLDADRLMKFLTEHDACPGDQTCRDMLKDVDADDSDDNTDHVQPIEMLEPATRLLPVEDGHVDHELQVDTWMRKIIIDNRDPNITLKVHFDGSSHSSGIQRGWANCDVHQCIRYRQIDRSEDQLDFCAEMYMWFKKRHDYHDKPQHLDYVPSRAEIDLARQHITLRDF